MAKTKNPDQIGMFVQGSVNPLLEMPADINSVPGPTVDPSQFPSVDLAERAVHLDKVLLTLGKHSQRTGLQLAGVESSPLRRGIEARYEDDTDRVIEGAANTKDKLLLDAKQDFAKAVGMSAMIASGIETKDEAKQSAREDFGSFLRKYADARNASARKTMRQKMQRTQREQARIRKVL